MPYDTSSDPYIDPKLGVLYNKLGAKTQKKLDAAEAEVTYIAIFTLVNGSKTDKLRFDAQFLLDIHKEIFRDIYAWAGKVRTHDIGKGGSYFAHSPYITPLLFDLLQRLDDDAQHKSGNINDFVSLLAHYYSELNAIHPFREGNGRAIRTFLRLLALKHEYDIEWDNMDPDENIRASQAAMGADDTLARSMLEPLVVKIV